MSRKKKSKHKKNKKGRGEEKLIEQIMEQKRMDIYLKINEENCRFMR
jgi:hypothetical protein